MINMSITYNLGPASRQDNSRCVIRICITCDKTAIEETIIRITLDQRGTTLYHVYIMIRFFTQYKMMWIPLSVRLDLLSTQRILIRLSEIDRGIQEEGLFVQVIRENSRRIQRMSKTSRVAQYQVDFRSCTLRSIKLRN